MQFTLFTKQGRILQFYVKAVADLYQGLYGGVVITQQVLDTTPTSVDA